jgi:hypothetical protein
MALQRKPAQAEPDPGYPDSQQYEDGRRNFLAKFGALAAGLAGLASLGGCELWAKPNTQPGGEPPLTQPALSPAVPQAPSTGVDSPTPVVKNSPPAQPQPPDAVPVRPKANVPGGHAPVRPEAVPPRDVAPVRPRSQIKGGLREIEHNSEAQPVAPPGGAHPATRPKGRTKVAVPEPKAQPPSDF